MSNMLKITGTALCLISTFVGGFGISVNNGGYEDINIVIENTIEENPTLLERIQEEFTNASHLLFEATRQQVYFRQINIILPKTWSSSSGYTEIPAMAEPESYIIVGNDEKAKVPHTKRKKKKCGYQGWYTYLNTDFLLTEGKTKWGYHANVLVHEWGHFRWGIFEEYGTEAKGRFYLDEGEWKPVRCSENVTGKAGKGTLCDRETQKCNTTDTGQLLNEGCKFCPGESQADSNMGSIMAFNWVSEVATFCDKDDLTIPINQRHNSKAPNKHNRKCDGRSAWEVMREHDDFKTAILSASTNTTPIFKILREMDAFRVFVLDVSGSMAKGTRIETLYQACEYIIQTKIPEGSWLGIVWFTTYAVTKMEMTQVTSQEVRDALIASVPQTVYDSTCIGCGIDEALVVLTRKLGNPAGSEIIVISDGKNKLGDLDESIQSAVTAHVTVHTISVSQDADERMIHMAAATEGVHISYLETGTISFASAFLEILSSGVTSSATESTTLLAEKLDSLTSNTVMFTFDIDSRVGMNTTVSILQGSSTNISIEVQSPDGTVYSEQTYGSNIILDIPGTAVTGRYNATVITLTSSYFEYYVTSLPTSTEVIRIISWVTPVNLDFSTGELPVIEADVMKGRGAVLNAIVTAVVETGGSDSCNVTLLDNGADPDDTMDDGVYAGVIPRFCIGSDGRVSAKVYARGGNGTASVQDVFSGAGSPDSDEDVDTEILHDDFQRVTLPNEILVSEYSSTIASQDITAPGRITDVSVIDISTENTQNGESRNFTITWTATGDDVNIGRDPDDTMNDGVYAGVIPRFCIGSDGRVSAKVYARGGNGTAAVQDVFSGAGSPDSDEDVDTEILHDDFQRVTLPNEILVSEYSSTIASQDITAPGRITDVSVIDISTENTQNGESRNFTITWTATGDDVNIGQAVEYELRISKDRNVLINDFSSADLLNIVSENFRPKIAGEAEFLRLKIDAQESYNSTAFFGVSAKDEAGNLGNASNIVSILVASGYRIKIEGDVVYSIAYKDKEIEDERNKNLTALAFGLSSAVIVITFIAVTICIKKLITKQGVVDFEFCCKTSTTKVVSIDKPPKGIFTTLASQQNVPIFTSINTSREEKSGLHHFDRSETCTRLSGEFPALPTDETNEEFEDVLVLK